MSLTNDQISQLIENYAEQVVDDMDMQCLMQMAYETIVENMSNMDANEVLEQIYNVYDEELANAMIESVGGNPADYDVNVPVWGW